MVTSISVFRALLVVHFWAPWAPQCSQMNEVMVELAKVQPEVTFVKVWYNLRNDYLRSEYSRFLMMDRPLTVERGICQININEYNYAAYVGLCRSNYSLTLDLYFYHEHLPAPLRNSM